MQDPFYRRPAGLVLGLLLLLLLGLTLYIAQLLNTPGLQEAAEQVRLRR